MPTGGALRSFVQPTAGPWAKTGAWSGCAPIALAGVGEQLLVGWGVGAHGGVHIPLHGNASRTFTAPRGFFRVDQSSGVTGCPWCGSSHLHLLRRLDLLSSDERL